MFNTLAISGIDEGKRIAALFSDLSEENKMMAIVYLSALRDKELADSGKKKELQEAKNEHRTHQHVIHKL